MKCIVAFSCKSYSSEFFSRCYAMNDGNGNACGWAENTSICKVKGCTDAVPSASAATCTSYMSTCAFNGIKCVNASACSTYTLNTFALCNATTDGAGNACGWATGDGTCKAKACTDAITTANAANCTAYISTCAYNGSICTVAAACSTYALTTFALCNATTDGAGNACGWATGDVACKAKACTDAVSSPSATTCSSYISSCAYNGSICTVAAACSTYALNTPALCNATTDGAGNACGWATGGVACKAKACTDAVDSATVAMCRLYINTCAFNGTACDIAGPCSSYAFNSFILCNATSDGAGNTCGWVVGDVTCKAKACTDTIPNPSAATCS